MIAVSAVDDGLASSWLISMVSECDEWDGRPQGVLGLSLGSWVKWQGQGRGGAASVMATVIRVTEGAVSVGVRVWVGRWCCKRSVGMKHRGGTAE